MSVTKEQLYEYQKRSRAKNLTIGISRALAEQMRNIRSYTTFKSDNDTLKYLLDLEKELRENKILNVGKVCDRCGKEIDKNLDSYVGITHKHIDKASNCSGYIKTKYRVKKEIEMSSGSTITNEEKDRANQPEQKTEQKDQQERKEQKEKKDAEEKSAVDLEYERLVQDMEDSF